MGTLFFLGGCAPFSAHPSLKPDFFWNYVGFGESSLIDHSRGEARRIAKKEAVVSLVSVVSSHVMEVRSRFLGSTIGGDAGASVIVSKLNLEGKVRFFEERKGTRIRVFAYLPKSSVSDRAPFRKRRLLPASHRLENQPVRVVGKGLANLSEYGYDDAREIAMRRAMKDALLKGRLLYQGSVSAQSVQLGSLHEQAIFLQDSFDILGMKVVVLPEIRDHVDGIRVRLLPVQVLLRLRAKSLKGPSFGVHLDHPFYQNGEMAHLEFRLDRPLYIAAFDRYGTSGSVVGILPTAEKLPENPHYRSTRDSFHLIVPGRFSYPPNDPRINLVAQLPSGVTKVSEEYLVILASSKPFPLNPRYQAGSPYFELDGKSFGKFMKKMLLRPISEWSMKTIPFVVYGTTSSK